MERFTLTQRANVPLGRALVEVAAAHRSKFYRFLIQTSLVFSIICALGFAYQTYVITMIYFSHEISSQAVIELPKNIYPPSVTLCFDLFPLINTRRYPEYDCINKSLEEQQRVRQCIKAFSNVTIKRRVEMSYSFEEIVTNISIRDSSTSLFIKYSALLKNLTEYHNFVREHVTVFLKKRLKCFKIDILQEGQFYRLNDLKHDFKHPHVMAKLTLNNKTLSRAGRFFFNFNPIGTLPRGYQFNPIELDFEAAVGRFWSVSYSRIETHLLPPPFETNCRDYKETSHFDSQAHCISECISDSFQANYSRLPTELVSLGTEDKLVGTLPNTDYYRQCEDNCLQVDCDSETFVPTLTKKKLNAPHHAILVTSPKSPDIIVHNFPKISFAEYLVYVASICSLWFGISILSALSQTKEMPKVIKYISSTFSITEAMTGAKEREPVGQPEAHSGV